MNPFKDQAFFMQACDQSVGKTNPKQMLLYFNLIKEELKELEEAMANSDRQEMLDAVLDLMVVVIGTGLSEFRVDQLEDGWDEVVASNMSKVDSTTGKVMKREDGKILKPATYIPPRLGRLL